MEEWTQTRLQQYIDDQVQEHLQLDYKEAAALDKRNQKRIEDITKDVSAFANSAGGVIIYGIKEAQNIPVSLDPVDISQATRETLDQIIGTIQPKIDGVVIYPVTINNDSTKQIFVIQVPQSTTAHQARDRKYYKRLNTTSEAMQDYEVRDVMNRGQYPHIELLFNFEYMEFKNNSAMERLVELHIHALNTGNSLAQYVIVDVFLPCSLLRTKKLDVIEIDGIEYVEFALSNEHEEVQVVGGTNYYSPTGIFRPALPKRSRFLDKIDKIVSNIDSDQFNELVIYWKVYADNAAVHEGTTLVKAIPLDKVRSPWE